MVWYHIYHQLMIYKESFCSSLLSLPPTLKELALELFKGAW